MKTISDVMLNLSHGHERAERLFLKRSERFSKEFGHLVTPEDAYGTRLTAIPVENKIRFDRVFHHGNISNGLDMPSLKIRKTNAHKDELKYPDRFLPSGWQPILRGSRAISSDTPSRLISFHEVYCDGLVECGYALDHSAPPNNMDKWPLIPDWPISMFANLAAWANRIRKQASLPTEKYVIEVELRSVGSAVPLYNSHSSVLEPGSIVFPKYSLAGTPEDVTEALSCFYRDFWNCFGQDIDDEQNKLEIQGQDDF